MDAPNDFAQTEVPQSDEIIIMKTRRELVDVSLEIYLKKY